jgi:hypothetical protein
MCRDPCWYFGCNLILGLDALGPEGDQTPMETSAGALASLVHANHGNVLRGSYVLTRGELPFSVHEVEFAFDRGFIRGYVATAHGGILITQAKQCRCRARKCGHGRGTCWPFKGQSISTQTRQIPIKRIRSELRHALVMEDAEIDRLRRAICRSFNSSPHKKKYWLELLEMYGARDKRNDQRGQKPLYGARTP